MYLAKYKLTADPKRVSELCIAWLRRHSNGRAFDVDDWTREEFQLREIDTEHFRDE